MTLFERVDALFDVIVDPPVVGQYAVLAGHLEALLAVEVDDVEPEPASFDLAPPVLDERHNTRWPELNHYLPPSRDNRAVYVLVDIEAALRTVRWYRERGFERAARYAFRELVERNHEDILVTLLQILRRTGLSGVRTQATTTRPSRFAAAFKMKVRQPSCKRRTARSTWGETSTATSRRRCG